jgi:hypothetical protein
VQPFDASTLTHPWVHADPQVDALQDAVMRAVGTRSTDPRRFIFDAVCVLAGLRQGYQQDVLPRAAIPYLDEPWYC